MPFRLQVLFLRMAIGLYVLNLGYGFEDSGKQLKEFHFVSSLFTGQESIDESREPGQSSTTHDSPLAAHNRFADSWLGYLPVPFPKNYLLGIDVQQRDFEDYDRPSYFRGEWQDHGWWYYYLYAAVLKVPLGTWSLGLLSLACCLRSHCRISIGRDQLILLLPAVVVFTVVSAKCGFNEHFRYILPVFPFLFVFVSSVAKYCRAAVLIVPLCCWMFASSLWVYPHSISYFNESIGGPLNGPKHLLGSCVDWGQDLRYLKQWLDNHAIKSGISGCYLARHGDYSPNDVGLSTTLPWPVPRSDLQSETVIPSGVSTESYCSSLFAISANPLYGLPFSIKGDLRGPVIIPREDFARFKGKLPVYRAGYSILVFDEDTASSTP